MVHCQTCAKQAKHHGDKAPRHKASGTRVELLRIRIGKLGKENPLRTFNQLAVDDFTAAQRRRPERQIKDMV